MHCRTFQTSTGHAVSVSALRIVLNAKKRNIQAAKLRSAFSGYLA